MITQDGDFVIINSNIEQAQQVLFLCTGNSCRSIMAECIMNARAGKRFTAYSAGSKPKGIVHPRALETLRQNGIDPPNTQSQSWNDFTDIHLDYVVTVCSNAAAETCPVFSGPAKQLDWSMEDPDAFTGTKYEKEAFQQTFLLLEKRIEDLIENSISTDQKYGT